jgi:hypothetical protein
MRLKVPVLDGRSVIYQGDAIDLDTGNTVGHLSSRNGGTWLDTKTGKYRRTPSWEISLLDRYHGQFETWHECAAFAEGVQAVLNRVATLAEYPPTEKSSAASAA